MRNIIFKEALFLLAIIAIPYNPEMTCYYLGYHNFLASLESI